MLVRRIARPLLASTFVFGGIDTLRNPQSRVAGARPVVEKVTEQADKQLPVQGPRDVEQWVKIDAAVKGGAGPLFSLGKLPPPVGAHAGREHRAHDAGRAPVLGG